MATSHLDRVPSSDPRAEEISALGTEQPGPHHGLLEAMSTDRLLRLMNREDQTVPQAVRRALPQITAVVDATTTRMSSGGRLCYVGAGTAGRLATVDAAECRPTFGVDPDLVTAILAGGPSAVIAAAEGAEDDLPGGRDAVLRHPVRSADVVIGVSASGRTPFVIGGLEAAGEIGALTVGLSCNARSPLSAAADLAIEVPVGPEILAGSTRLKAGTAQKLVLNMISTAVMVRLGHTYRGLMVDMRVSNDKLRARAITMIGAATGADPRDAGRALAAAHGSIKSAIVMLALQVDVGEAARMLAAAGGRLDAVLPA